MLFNFFRGVTLLSLASSLAPIAEAAPAGSATIVDRRALEGFTPIERSTFERALTANICAKVGLQVPSLLPIGGGTPIGPSTCFCLADGQLTHDSLQAIIDIVNNPVNAAIIKALTAVTGGIFGSVDDVIAYLANQALEAVGVANSACTYPEGSIPDSCDDCSYKCPDGEIECGDACVDPDTTDCNSNVARKRDVIGGNTMCPAELTACAVPTSEWFTGRNYECIDIQTDLESCGACVYPLPGQPAGVDCTSLPHTNGVTCFQGKCLVEDCERGYELNTDGTGCVAQAGSSLSSRRRR